MTYSLNERVITRPKVKLKAGDDVRIGEYLGHIHLDLSSLNATNREVITECRKNFKDEDKKNPALREIRHHIYKHMIKEHKKAKRRYIRQLKLMEKVAIRNAAKFS
jgi:hypothetical protein